MLVDTAVMAVVPQIGFNSTVSPARAIGGRIVRLFMLLLLLLNVASARAAELRPWWISAGAGIGEVEVIGHDRSELVVAALSAAGYEVNGVLAGEDDATRTRDLGVGYRFTRLWSLSLRYLDLGSTDGGFIADTDTGGQLQGSIESEYRALSLAAGIHWPLSSWFSLQGQLGLHRWQHEFELRGWQQDTGIAVVQQLEDSGNGLLFAVGAGFQVLPWLGFDIGWQRMHGIESEDGIDVKTIRAVFSF